MTCPPPIDADTVAEHFKNSLKAAVLNEWPYRTWKLKDIDPRPIWLLKALVRARSWHPHWLRHCTQAGRRSRRRRFRAMNRAALIIGSGSTAHRFGDWEFASLKVDASHGG